MLQWFTSSSWDQCFFLLWLITLILGWAQLKTWKLFYIVYLFLFGLISASYASSEKNVWNLRIHSVVPLLLPGRSSLNIFCELIHLTSGKSKHVELELSDRINLGWHLQNWAKDKLVENGIKIAVLHCYWKLG